MSSASRSVVARRLNVLVLAVSGNVSQGILKALQLSGVPVTVVGADVDPMGFGLFTCDVALVSPWADEPSFVPWLERTCRKHSIDVVLSGAEPVLRRLAENVQLLRDETGALALVSSTEKLLVAQDKLATCRWLKVGGFNFPRYAQAQDSPAVSRLVAASGFPLIAKPRYGKGSGGVLTIRDEGDLRTVTSQGVEYVIQELLGTSDQEYTVGCLCDSRGQLRGSIVLRRELLHGTTSRAVVDDNPAAREEAERIVSRLQPYGPCNIQMRVVGDTAVCFEINLRFSGSTPIRARFGFNEVQAVLEHFVLGHPMAALPRVTDGVALRYWNEAYIDARALQGLQSHGELQNVHDFRLVVEDYGLRP
jgi:carbamoyl-phosphate synthase large subunit